MSKLKVTAIIEFHEAVMDTIGINEANFLQTAIKRVKKRDLIPIFSKIFISFGYSIKNHAMRIEMWSNYHATRQLFFEQCKNFIQALQQEMELSLTISMIQD